jgi:hypothetical protein
VVTAAGSLSVKALINRPTRQATLLAAFPTAVYVRLFDDQVIALLTRDAVRLPCGLVLAATSTEQPLIELHRSVATGAGQVRVGSMTVEISRTISVSAPAGLVPDAAAVERAGRELEQLGFTEHGPGLVDTLAASLLGPQEVVDPVRRLLGAGSGLTPSGDDVLAGFLVASQSFGVCADELRSAVSTHASGATTDLSAALLRHAARGESIPQVDALLRALAAGRALNRVDEALADLVRVGHTSGVALATGIQAAAQASIELRSHLLETPCSAGLRTSRRAVPQFFGPLARSTTNHSLTLPGLTL